MPNLLQSFRANKQPTTLKGFTVQANSTALDESSTTDQPEVISAYDYLASKNPVLNDLVTRLDLIEFDNPQLVVVDPALASPPVSSPESRERLRSIAIKSLTDGISYTHDEAINQIMQISEVSRGRAENGLAMMLSESIISSTPAGTYFLSGTVPF